MHDASAPLTYDILIIGGGPSGLAAALHLRRIAPHLAVCLLDKARRPGGHALSGALLHPDDLTPLLPLDIPWDAPVSEEHLLFLTRRHALPLPPPASHAGCRMISLSRLCRTLAEAATRAGAEILCGFAAHHPLIREGRLTGVEAGGALLHGRLTLLAEGCRGHITGEVIRAFDLRRGLPPQTFGLGLKEVWETPSNQPGRALHTLGWPLDRHTHGGGFLYEMTAGRIALGVVTALDYRDPRLDPHALLQAWKTHPRIAPLLHGGRPLAFGARCLVEGGWQALPELTFPGGMLLGDAAGFLDPVKLQGIGGAIRSGVTAAEVAARALTEGEGVMGEYAARMAASDWGQALRRHRNLRPGFRPGREIGLLHGAMTLAAHGREPWTWRWRQRDRERLCPAQGAGAPPVPGVDALLALAGLRHRPGQPGHLVLADPRLPGNERFDYPETRYCPSRVFTRDGEGRLLLHPENCLHCKTCDIKDPGDAIRWTPPEAGSGPDYGGM